MKFVARTLARIDVPDGIVRVPALAFGDMPAIIAGSEGDRPLLPLRPPEYRPEVLAERPGGFITLCLFARAEAFLPESRALPRHGAGSGSPLIAWKWQRACMVSRRSLRAG